MTVADRVPTHRVAGCRYCDRYNRACGRHEPRCACVGRRNESAADSASARAIRSGDTVNWTRHTGRFGNDVSERTATVESVHGENAYVIDAETGVSTYVGVSQLRRAQSATTDENLTINAANTAIDHCAPGAVYRCGQVDISTDCRTREAFVIIAALEEYASTHRRRAEFGDNAEFLHALANTADQLREQFHAQMHDGANVVESVGSVQGPPHHGR